MSSLLYWIGMKLYGLLLSLLAPFHRKAGLLVRGRKASLRQIKQLPLSSQGRKSLWFHFSSLGEFEQGRPVLEEARRLRPDHLLIVTFYSPSGYEIRKNTPLADHVFYLPSDSPKHARTLLKHFQPELIIFTKYEYWPFYFREIQKMGVPLYVISAIFRPEQAFFSWYGEFFRRTLACVTHFFTQNERSLYLLSSIGMDNASLAGDTRFDRVVSLPENRTSRPEIEEFVGTHFCLVAGSTWPGDESVLAALLQGQKDWKMILAPHEIQESRIAAIEKQFPGSVRYSHWSKNTVSRAEDRATSRVLIMDNIGMLSTLYGYGNLAYIGGGFHAPGIHNTLEAAAYGVPVLFGPNYYKFEEASGLIDAGAAFSVNDDLDLLVEAEKLSDPIMRQRAGDAAARYVQDHAGATARICAILFNADSTSGM